jgi:hypothetical protein
MANQGSSSDGRPLVDENEELWIGVILKWVKWAPDGTCTPSTGLFQSSTRDISVFIASRTTPEHCMEMNRRWVGLVAISAALIMDLGHQVVEDPLPGNPAHAEILGKISKSHRRRIVSGANWIVRPERPSEQADE